MKPPRNRLQALLALILTTFTLSQAQQTTQCGSLITYRQFDTLTTTAPQCFKSGCTSPSPSPLSMSTSCPSTSPCYPLFNSLRTNWQAPSTSAYCSPSTGCTSDTACRIPGWPILNSTASCNLSPHEWLFSNSNSGGCCTSGTEPFELADWMGRLCNGSEWRAPFEYYDGMARDEWIEWRQPWNWTVRQRNTSAGEFTMRNCDSATAMYVAFIADNLVSAGEAMVELFVYWFLCICGIQEAMKDVKPPMKAVIGGVISGGLYMVSNFATAIMWEVGGGGYQDIPRGYVGLLLCSRPSVLGFLCLVSIFGREKVGEEHTARRLGWIDGDRAKRVRRRVGRRARRVMGVFKRGGREGYEVTDDELVEGRAKAQQLLTSFSLTIGISELCLQFSSLYSIWKTMLVGFDRGFYKAPALLPFEGGSAAARMYGGALLHSFLCIPSTFVLVGIAWYHVEYDLIQRLVQKYSRQRKMIAKLSEYYAEKDGRLPDRVPSEEERAKDRRMFREQRVLERLIAKRADPGFWKRGWLKVKRGVGRPLRRLGRVFWAICRCKWREVRPLWRQQDPVDTTTDERALRTGKYPRLAAFRERTVGVIARVSGRLQEKIAAAEQPRPVTVQPGFYRPRHLLGRFLSKWPFRKMIVSTSVWAERQTSHRRQQLEKAEDGPDRVRFDELVRIRDFNMANPPPTPSWRAWLPSARKGIFWATAFFVTVNYLSQWLFWSGYVENAGDRWCPPNDEFSIEKGLWAAVAAVALLVSVLFSSDSQPQTQ